MPLMLRLVIATCAASCAALVSVAPATAAPTCHPRHSRTVARKGGTRLFLVGGGGAGEYSAPSTLYVCQRSRGRAVRLIHVGAARSLRLAHVRFDGRYVAFDATVGDETCFKYDPGPQCSSETLRSYNVRDGRRRATAHAACDALALTSNGWIAWVPPGTGPRSVLAVDSTGSHQLDAGAIDPASLRATGRTVRWTNAGQPRSARLR